jgi:hypothetical protein
VRQQAIHFAAQGVIAEVGGLANATVIERL